MPIFPNFQFSVYSAAKHYTPYTKIHHQATARHIDRDIIECMRWVRSTARLSHRASRWGQLKERPMNLLSLCESGSSTDGRCCRAGNGGEFRGKLLLRREIYLPLCPRPLLDTTIWILSILTSYQIRCKTGSYVCCRC